MKKKILFALPLLTSVLASCVGTKIYPCSDYLTSVEWVDQTEDFRILQLCDIHLSQSDIYDKHFKVINNTIKASNADLIVLNGDSFTYADKGVVAKLFAFIDSYNIPWTFTYGNHDDQGYFSDTYIQEILKDNSVFKNVKFVSIGDDNITGRSNFVINIQQKSRDMTGLLTVDTVFQVYCLESHSYNFDTIAYDYIKQDQIDWYERMVSYSKEKFGGGKVVPSAMYFHIPLPEFFTAWKEKDSNPESVLIMGSTDEMGGGPKVETDLHLFDKVKELGSTKAISCAHDHVNDSVIKYKDVALCFGVHSTDRIYYDETKIGGQVIVVNKDTQALTFENIYTTYKEVEGK